MSTCTFSTTFYGDEMSNLFNIYEYESDLEDIGLVDHDSTQKEK